MLWIILIIIVISIVIYLQQTGLDLGTKVKIESPIDKLNTIEQLIEGQYGHDGMITIDAGSYNKSSIFPIIQVVRTGKSFALYTSYIVVDEMRSSHLERMDMLQFEVAKYLRNNNFEVNVRDRLPNLKVLAGSKPFYAELCPTKLHYLLVAGLPANPKAIADIVQGIISDIYKAGGERWYTAHSEVEEDYSIFEEELDENNNQSIPETEIKYREVLGIEGEITRSKLKEAYRTMSKLHHPDLLVNKTNGEDSKTRHE